MIYRVRGMLESDVEAVLALAAALPSAPHWPRESYLAALGPESQPKRIALVAEAFESGGPKIAEIAGFAVASLLPPESELESIAVAPAFQRLGVARRLVEVLRGELRAAGVRDLLLEVRASNQAALGLYRSLGFEQTGRRLNYYANSDASPSASPDPGTREDALLFRLAL
jgi:[ribosomal protein S18]-alanine N-acetyltransferase